MINSHFSVARSWLPNLFRQFSVTTSQEKLFGIDLSNKKIQSLSKKIPTTRFPLECDWETPSPIYIHNNKPSPNSGKSKKNFYYIGGLPALMQAAQKLAESPSDINVFYVRGSDTPKTLLSGHQGHVHPTEWPTDECGFRGLIKTMFQGMNLVEQDNPADLDNYSYLHFSLQMKDLIAQPFWYLNMFGSCFIQKIKHSLTANSYGVSKQDQWLCDTVAQSLKTHHILSEKIRLESGEPTFTQTFRIYWSPNAQKMKKKETIWRALNIPVEPMNAAEKKRYTLLNDTSSLHVLKILSDGKFYPETPERIISHLSKKYSNFQAHVGSVTDVYTNAGKVECLAMNVEIDKLQRKVFCPADYLFGSLGHNQVMMRSSITGKWKSLWPEIPVSGISSVWKCSLTRQELQKRWEIPSLCDQEIRERINAIVPAANLSNLHVTSWDCTIQGDNIVMMVRVSEGANFNSNIAFKNDLLNMSLNLHNYFIGNWELIAAGSCTRKTWATNTPELIEVSNTLKFLHGLSGIGYSFSAAPTDSLKHP